MEAAGPIRWLASYPKSGNTWLRALLSGYLSEESVGLDINRLIGPYVTAGRNLLEEHLGVESTDLLPVEIDRLWPEVYRHAAGAAKEPLIWKTHDAWRKNDLGNSLFPADACGPAIYLVRNPMDVAVSFANHQGWSMDKTVKAMANRRFLLSGYGDGARSQLHEVLGHWSDHVASWLDQSELHVELVRYEDLHADPVTILAKVLRHLQFSVKPEQVRLAVEKASFERLQAQEKEIGFGGKNPAGGRFFRRGKVGSWRDELPARLQEQIRSDHFHTMRRLGYD